MAWRDALPVFCLSRLSYISHNSHGPYLDSRWRQRNREQTKTGMDTKSFSSAVVDCSAPLPGSKQSVLQRFKLPVPAGHGNRKTSSGNGVAFFVSNGERPETLPNDMWYALSDGRAGSSAAIHDFIRSQTKAALKKVKTTSALKTRCLDRGYGAMSALVLVDGAKPSASERGALKRLMAKHRTVRWCEFLLWEVLLLRVAICRDRFYLLPREHNRSLRR